MCNSFSSRLTLAVIKEVTERVGRDWKQVGRALGLTRSELEHAERQNSGSLRERILEVFHLWRQRQGHDVTVERLEAALTDNGLGHLLTEWRNERVVDLNEKQLGPPLKKLKSGVVESDDEVSAYRDFLVNFYSSKFPTASKWPEMGSNEHINQTIYAKRAVEGSEENQMAHETFEWENLSVLEEVELTQVGTDGSGRPCSVSIITGAPGVGKSCFAWRLATKWKEGELFKECRLAIVVRLRDSYIRKANKVEDLIEHDNQQMRENIGNWMTTNNGHGCLFILDGFDELPADLQRESIIREIISGGKVAKALLIVTTRSTAAKELYNICSKRKCQYLEILGFGKEEVEKYILSSFKTDTLQKGFQQYLQCYPSIKSFMCIPLHCVIVVQIYKSQRSQRQAPKTMTELFTEAIKVLIIRSLQQDYPDFTNEGLDSFNDLPEEVQQCLKELARIAYESTLKDEVQFHYKFSKQLRKLDLVEEKPDVYNPASSSVSYHFVHMTIQEFLAAYHIATLPLDEQSSIIRKELCTRRMAVVLKFVAGLTKFSQLTDVHDQVFTTDDVQTLMQCIHCLFETQDAVIITKALEIKRTLDFTLQALSSHDCYALNYCTVMSKVPIILRLESCKVSEEAFTMLLQPISDNKSMFFYIQELVITRNFALMSRISELCVASMRNSCLTSMWIEKCNIDGSGVEYIKKLLLQTKTLKHLALNANPIGDIGAKHLGDGLKENHSLQYLIVKDSGISHAGAEAISEALVHNSTLIEMNICGNAIGNPALSSLCKKLAKNFSLKKLLLQSCIFNPDDECIQNLRALSEKEDFKLCVDYPIEALLQSSDAKCSPKKNFVEPERRNGGCGVIVGEKLFIWGGQTEIKGKVGGMRYLPYIESHPFDVWDFTTQTWSHQPTTGDVPILGIGSSLVAYSRWLYLYGGLTEYGKNVFAEDLYRVSLDTFKWEMVPVPPASFTTIKPSPRFTTGIIVYDDKLCMFGGLGPKIIEEQDPGAEWVKAVNRDEGVFGWNNEYYEFDLKNDCWSAPLRKDAYRPEPISSFTFCKFSCHKAILFGGSGSENKGYSYSDDMYHFDLEIRVWTRLVTHTHPWPLGCRFHSLSPLFDPEFEASEYVGPRWMVLLWGKISAGAISKDAWALNVENWTWKKLELPDNLIPRAWHIACSHYARCSVVIIGGNMVSDDGFYKGRDAVANLQFISFDEILPQVQKNWVCNRMDKV